MVIKYWLDIVDDIFILSSVDDLDAEPICGHLSEIGIDPDDNDWTDKLDEYFETEHGIAPEEWELG